MSALSVILEASSIIGGAVLQRIEDVVANVLDAMRKRGIGDYSIKCTNWSVYRPIINWHHENGVEVCSLELLESLCAHQQKRYEDGNISRKFYRSFVTAAFRIRSYVSTGEVDFSIVKDTKWYKPNKENQACVDLILEDTGLKKEYQKKLSIPIRHFFCFIENHCKEITQISDKDFLDFIHELAKTNQNNMGIVIQALKFTADYLNASQLTKIKTDLGLFRPQTPPRRLIQPYTQLEISSILDAVDGHSQTPMRDRAIILLAFNSGLRCVDIRNLKLGDINWKAQELKIIQKKTGKPIAAVLNGKTLNAIADYILRERPKRDDNSVFIRAYPPYTGIASTSPLDYMIDKYCRLAGIEKKSYRSFHSLRRAFGTELAEAEVPVTSISQMLGHSDMSSGKAYLSFNRTQTALCSADFSEVPISRGIYADVAFPSCHDLGKER